jgi:predicted phage tail protein
MRLIFHGELRNRFGAQFEMDANSVADALEGFSRQVDWPADMLVDVVGYDSPEKLQQKPDEIHVMPSLRGGGGKFGSIILGTVMVVAGVLLLPANPALGMSLIVSGGLMVAQGVFALFLKTPKLSKNNDPDGSKYLGVNKNTTDIGTPMILAWGLIDLAGHWLSLQSDSNNLVYGVFPTNPT